MKLAIIGTGMIVGCALECLEQIPSIERKAIYARPHSKDKAQDLAQKYAIQEVYTDYDQLLAHADCDTVYIGLINKVHYEYAKKALLDNKHVILEKPFCVNAQETKELIDLAQEKKRYLFEAFRPLHTPNFLSIKEDLPKLGPIKCIQCNYSQYSSRYNAYKEKKALPALDPKLYGGSLYDINIYNVTFVVALFGLPKHVKYYANLGFNGVDTSGTVFMEYDHFYALCTGAKDSDSPGHALIQGEDGYISIDDGANLIGSYHLCIHKESTHINKNLYSDWMMHEFKDFEEMIEKQEYQKMRDYLKITYETMQVVDQAIASIPYGIEKANH